MRTSTIVAVDTCIATWIATECKRSRATFARRCSVEGSSWSGSHSRRHPLYSLRVARSQAKRRASAPRVTLIVDDDESLLAAWTHALRRSGQVLTAPDLATGLRLGAVVVPTTAIVDLRLGNDLGLPLVRALRRRSKTMRIAVMSGYLTVNSTVAAVKAGADVVVGKPVTPNEVLRLLEEPAAKISPMESASIRRIEWQHLHGALADANGCISQAARQLRVFRQSLARKLRKPMPPF